MPRPDNQQLKQAILTHADALFRERGYRAASYAEIAAAADTTKGHLQYYFRKKDDLACAVMTGVLERAREALGIEKPCRDGSERTYQELYRIGQAYFSYLLGEGGYRLFLRDVVGDLDLVESVLAFNMGWALSYAGMDARSREREVAEAVVRSIGGFYSLLHYDLVRGWELDVRRHLLEVVLDFMCALDMDRASSRKALERARLTDEELAAATRAMAADTRRGADET